MWWRDYSQTLFYKIKLRIFLDNSQKIDTVCIYCMANSGLSKILKLSCRPLAFTSYKALLKNKR